MPLCAPEVDTWTPVRSWGDHVILLTALDVRDDASVGMLYLEAFGDYEDEVRLSFRDPEKGWSNEFVTERDGAHGEAQSLSIGSGKHGPTWIAVGRYLNFFGEEVIELFEKVKGGLLKRSSPPTFAGFGGNLVVGDDGTVWLTYAAPGAQSIRVVRRDVGAEAWIEDLVLEFDNLSGNAIRAFQLAGGPDNQVVLAVASGDDVRVWHRGGSGAWSSPERIVDHYVDTAMSLAVSRDGDVFLAYLDQRRVFVKTQISGSWTEAEEIAESMDNFDLDTAIGPDGRPWVTFVRYGYDLDQPDMQMLAHRQGNTWVQEEFVPVARPGASLVFDRRGALWLAAPGQQLELRTRCASGR